MANSNNERVQPIRVHDENGNVYELDFCRESIKFAEQKGLSADDIVKFPVSKFPDLFFYAFRMHHRNVPRNQTDKMFYARYADDDAKHEEIKTALMERLVELYAQAMNANTVGSGEGDEKNVKVTVEL